jgi:hypothetical protein
VEFSSSFERCACMCELDYLVSAYGLDVWTVGEWIVGRFSTMCVCVLDMICFHMLRNHRDSTFAVALNARVQS